MKDYAEYTKEVDGLAMVPFWLLEAAVHHERRRFRFLVALLAILIVWGVIAWHI